MDGKPSQTQPIVFTWAGTVEGARLMMPVGLFAFPFGAAFGVAALQQGLDPVLSIFMSAVVFAGASQFVALDFWASPMAIVPLLLAVFAVNARHILLGASLYPWLKGLPIGQRFFVVTVLSDANWIVAMQASQRGGRDAGALFGGGLVLWATWTAGTVLGVYLGNALESPERFGLDVVMVTFFAVSLPSLWQGKTTALPWIVAGVVSMLAVWFLPPNWHILAGGLAGGVTGAILHGE
ncbi:MAG: AzlC family ABC transporter permease [Rhodospirillales bacterium]|nr:AzlC family ABC transporter permease [Rhodospirillales bacterium]